MESDHRFIPEGNFYLIARKGEKMNNRNEMVNSSGLLPHHSTREIREIVDEGKGDKGDRGDRG